MKVIKKGIVHEAEIKILLNESDHYDVHYNDITLFTGLHIDDAYTIYYKLGGK